MFLEHDSMDKPLREIQIEVTTYLDFNMKKMKITLSDSRSETMSTPLIMQFETEEEIKENIKKNIEAWLKKPDLGMIPIFMAGDKYFFYYALHHSF